MAENTDKVYVRVTTDRNERQVYVCRRKAWDLMNADEQRQEVEDRLLEFGIYIEVDCDYEEESK